MELEYKPIRGYQKERSFVCPHNSACVCVEKNCICCGWHPKVAQLRMDKLMGVKNGKK